MNWYFAVLKKYAGFSGRARRKEYWMFILIHVITIIALAAIDRAVFPGRGLTLIPPYDYPQMITSIYYVATLLPTLAVVVRRLHDTGRSGFWCFVALVPLVGAIVLVIFLVNNGVAGRNQYGADPKEHAYA